MKIYEKLGTIQTKLKAPKNQFNKFGGYTYRNVEDIQESVKPLLEETKTVLTIYDDIEQIGDRYYVKATATIAALEDDSSISVTAFAREPLDRKGMDDAQVTGATSSYARKYALGGLFLLDDTKDADADNAGNIKQNNPSAKKAPSPKNEEKNRMVDSLMWQLKRTGVGLKGMLQAHGVERVEDMTEQQLASAIAQLSVKPEKTAEPKRPAKPPVNPGFQSGTPEGCDEGLPFR